MTQKEIKQIAKLVDLLFWDYDRLSNSGRITLDELADLLGLPSGVELQ